MKTRAAVCIAVAVSLAAPGLSFGQGRGNSDRDRDDRVERHDNGVRRHGPPEWANNRHDRYPDGRREWKRGDHLPREYRDRQYVVEDWRMHRLPPPPAGHVWVQAGAEYLLVAVATGLIVQLLLNR